MIGELRIDGFRGFASLELKDLKRVNLVVGQNNSGKTSLLEAIFLLCDPNDIEKMPGVFRAKQGNPNLRYFRWLLRDRAEGDIGLLRCMAGGEERALVMAGPSVPDETIQEKIPGQVPPVDTGPNRGTRWPTAKYAHESASLKVWAKNARKLPCRFVSTERQSSDALVTLVGKAQRRKEGEETLQRLLGDVDPRIKKVRVDPGEDGNQVIVDIGLSELIPIAQAGQGVYRLVTILADIIAENPEVVLIDEVENGLHHSVHRQIWTGLAETAEKLNVQIIATTHSEECLRAAHRAFLDRPSYDLSVIQLFRMESEVRGRVLDREHIEAALAGNIELR